MKIEFDHERHEYKINGIIFPSVTTIISDLNLIDTTWFKPEHAERGNHIHLITQMIDENDLDYDTVDDSYKGYMSAYEKFLKECKPEWFEIEKIVVCNTHRYAGKFDRSGIINRKNCLLDVKSGVSHWTHGLQTAAYKHAFGDLGLKRYGLYLRKGGDYKLKEYSDRNDIKHFKNACALWWRKNDNK